MKQKNAYGCNWSRVFLPRHERLKSLFGREHQVTLRRQGWVEEQAQISAIINPVLFGSVWLWAFDSRVSRWVTGAQHLCAQLAGRSIGNGVELKWRIRTQSDFVEGVSVAIVASSHPEPVGAPVSLQSERGTDY